MQQDDRHNVEQDAYQKGLFLKQMHMKRHHVLDAASLLQAAADVAHLSLCQEWQCVQVSDPHTRAALRMTAFQQGYQQRSLQERGKHLLLGTSLGEDQKRTRNHLRSKRKGKRFASNVPDRCITN